MTELPEDQEKMHDALSLEATHCYFMAKATPMTKPNIDGEGSILVHGEGEEEADLQ